MNDIMYYVAKVAVASRAANRAKNPEAVVEARRELQVRRMENAIDDVLSPTKDGYVPLPFEDRKALANLLVGDDGYSVQKKR